MLARRCRRAAIGDRAGYMNRAIVVRMARRLLVLYCMKTLAVIAFTLLGAAACKTSTPGAQPHDMSAAQHEAMAANEEKTAKQHASQYNPNARETNERCGGSRAGDGGCWSSIRNP